MIFTKAVVGALATRTGSLQARARDEGAMEVKNRRQRIGADTLVRRSAQSSLSLACVACS